MPVANCKRCGRIYNRVRRDICSACIKEEDEIYLLVREFLRQHPDASMGDVLDNTGVELETLVEMIQDGRLIISNNPNLLYSCERCGNDTQSGRYCVQCTKELVTGFEAAATQLSNKKSEPKPEKRGYFSK